MSGDFPYAAKIVSPLKCNEKPWDLWVSEIGHPSPRRDDDGATFAAPAAADGKQRRYRRAGVSRLRHDSMSLHGLFPQADELRAAVCHMCGVVVKCSAAYRHLRERHRGAEPILPPPPPTVKLKSAPGRSRHKKEPPPPAPMELLPAKMEAPAAPAARAARPPPELQYSDDAGACSALAGEVQVSVESGELPVVSIQDTEELPLGENITDDIVAIMNSEGIQSADDITNLADWKNIIQDIGNMQEINFQSTTDVQQQDLYPSVDSSLACYTITDADLSNLQFTTTASPMLPSVIDNSLFNAQALKPTLAAPTTKVSSRKSSKTKSHLREYDPNKHCGVLSLNEEVPKPCTRSLTCKTHALSLRRTVEGRAKPFDTLLAEHRASRDSAAQAAAAQPAALALLAGAPPELGALAAEQQVSDIYASLLGAEQPAPPDAAPLGPAPPEDAPAPDPPPLVPADVCWYAACPRPLALCTYNASLAGGAVALGKKFATVRSNIKSSLSRSSKQASGNANSYYGQSLSLSKTMHMNNASKTNKPEVRKLIVTCSAGCKEARHSLSELFGDARHALAVNGHAERRRALKGRRAGAALELGFALDPLLADEKC